MIQLPKFLHDKSFTQRVKKQMHWIDILKYETSKTMHFRKLFQRKKMLIFYDGIDLYLTSI